MCLSRLRGVATHVPSVSSGNNHHPDWLTIYYSAMDNCRCNQIGYMYMFKVKCSIKCKLRPHSHESVFFSLVFLALIGLTLRPLC